MQADSGFYAHALVAVCREMDVRFSITIRQHARRRNLIEAIPETDWTPIPYWMDGAADVAEDYLHPVPDQAGQPSTRPHGRFPRGGSRRVQSPGGDEGSSWSAWARAWSRRVCATSSSHRVPPVSPIWALNQAIVSRSRVMFTRWMRPRCG